MALRTEPRPAAQTRDSGWIVLAAVVGVLSTIGLMMVLSASSVEAFRIHGGAWVFFLRQLVWVGFGGLALLVTASVDYRRWRRLVVPLTLTSFVLLVAVLLPGVGVTVSGSTRWLDFGPLRVQPSELAKLAVLLFAADLVARRAEGGSVEDARATLRPVLVTGGILAGLVLCQPDMGTAMVIVLILVAVLFVGGVPLGQMSALTVVTAVSALLLGLGAGYRRARMMSFLRPFDDFSNAGYQLSQSLVAFGTGSVTGVGLGASRAKWGFLPNAHTDFIFAIIGEELGLLGSLFVLTLFVGFAAVGVRTALRAPDRFGTILAAGVTAWVAGQAVVNMGAVTGMLPVTGVPLPFVSFGGSALVVTMAAVGILINIARQPGTRRAGR
jgi:cell division protein FtsW